MKLIFSSLLILVSIQAWSNSDSLLNQAGSEIDLSSKIQNQKQINLDNPFVIQLFSSWKAMGPIEPATSMWIEQIINKEHAAALAQIPSLKISSKDLKLNAIKEASELYLNYQVGNYQTFFNRFIEISSTTNFLKTELGIALDQIVGPKATSLLIENGFYLTEEKSLSLSKIETIASKVNYSLQAFKALRTRENAVAWIGKLPENDPLRMPLAQTAILFYAKDGKLGASAKILKSVIEPVLMKSGTDEELALYFMTLGRLLYQAGALAESKKYYDLIPESSSYFVKAKTEVLWALLREKNYSRTKGELASLELNIFKDKFYPEAYLISAMANVILCQFTESKLAFNRFIEVNKNWAREIDKNLNDENASAVSSNFFLQNLDKAKSSLTNEKAKLVSNKFNESYVASIDKELSKIDAAKKKEIKSQWLNRKTILETALYKMKFVKVELISRMRQVEMNMRVAGADEVSSQNAAPVRNNEISFPKDKTIWGDELFHMSASIKNKCIMGELKPLQKGESK